jgi:hypothetical protein
MGDTPSRAADFPSASLPTVDGLIAATTLLHDLTLITRNLRDVERTGVRSTVRLRYPGAGAVLPTP